MSTKRNNPEHSTPSDSNRHKRNKAGGQSPINCLVCFNFIVEYNEKQGIDGDDAIFCEGKCYSWIHRMCVGLSKKGYQELSEDDSPYLCPHCKITQQANEIAELKEVVISLTSDLKLIKEELLKAKDNTTSKWQSHSDTGTTLPTNSNEPNISIPNTTQQTNADITSTVANILSEEREKEKHQLNLIVHQLAESTQEEPQTRKAEDILLYCYKCHQNRVQGSKAPLVKTVSQL